MSQHAHAIAYLRCSTDEQSVSGLGIAAQRAVLEVEAARRGWTLDFVVDDGYSARTMQRPGLSDALGRLAAGEAQVLVVAKLDRVTRALSDFADLMQRARREGWALVALDLGVDTSTPVGELVANVMASVAQWELRTISDRTSAALQAKKRGGARLGRPSAVPRPVLQRVAAERAAGRTLAEIAESLNASGATAALGGAWRPNSVARALRSHELDQEALAIRESVAARG